MNPALKISLQLLGALILGSFASLPAQAQIRSVRLASGLSTPVGAYSPDGDLHRIFIVEQVGTIRILKDGVLLPTPFLNVSSKVNAGLELGLLGLAFHPNYASNGKFFISYTRLSDGASIVEGYQVSTTNPDVANPSTAQILIPPISQLTGQHKAGCIQFGPDGKFYYALGDGGGAGDSGPGHPAVGNGQSTNTLLGKVLRLDVDLPSPHVPPDNPFVGMANYRPEIWFLGVRNPWRISFDRRTGDMFLGDVGNGTREEIDFGPAGVGGTNYGWKCMEGTLCTGLPTCSCNLPAWTPPIEEIDHSFACAIIGGSIYRGCAIPSLQGHYFYGDYCSGRIWSFTYNGVTQTKGAVIERTSQLAPGAGQSITNITAFGEDGYGELLILDRDGELYKIVPTAMTDCNGNGVSDSCDLSSGNALDVNHNAILDECEGAAPLSYCAGKTNSVNCVPTMSWIGYSSATRGFGFVVNAGQALNNELGLLLYGMAGQAALPFQGGTLCVSTPVKRAIIADSGGTPAPVNDCSGIFSIDMNSFAVGNLGGRPAPALRTPGTVVNCQWWGRDSGLPAPAAVQLSNGLQFQVCP